MKKVTIGNAELYCGDCFEILQTLADESIDACISDPPYAAVSFNGKCTACEWDKPIPLPEFWQLLERKTKPTANTVLFCNMKFAYDLIDTNIKNFRYDLVWCKNHRVGFMNAAKMPLRAHELILVFGRQGYRDASTYNPVKTPGGRPVVRQGIRRKGGVYPAQEEAEASVTVGDGLRYPNSLLAFTHDRENNQKGLNFHPTAKPLLLMAYLTYTYSNEGDTVLDCFMGSGTTGIAATKLGRKFIGIEQNPEYFAIACQRFEAERAKWRKAG